MKTLSISGNVRPAFRKFTFNLLYVCVFHSSDAIGERDGWNIRRLWIQWFSSNQNGNRRLKRNEINLSFQLNEGENERERENYI